MSTVVRSRGWGEALSLACLESSQVILMRDCGLIKCSAISLGILESLDEASVISQLLLKHQ